MTNVIYVLTSGEETPAWRRGRLCSSSLQRIAEVALRNGDREPTVFVGKRSGPPANVLSWLVGLLGETTRNGNNVNDALLKEKAAMIAEAQSIIDKILDDDRVEVWITDGTVVDQKMVQEAMILAAYSEELHAQHQIALDAIHDRSYDVDPYDYAQEPEW